MPELRTFVAVTIETGLAADIGRRIDELKRGHRQVRWVRPDLFHFTLAFLGDIDPRQVPELCRTVDEAVKDCPTFEIQLVGVGGFPSLERPSTLWIGVDEGRKEMMAAQSVVSAALEPHGFRPEKRSYSPHLTIGRLDRFKPPTPELIDSLMTLQDYDFGSMDVDCVRVMKSDLDRSGPTYSTMATCPLHKRKPN